MINRIYSVLARNAQGPDPLYCRRVDATAYRSEFDFDTVLNALVPPRTEEVLRYSTVEQLVQVLLQSSSREAALTFDPLNTYEKAKLSFPLQQTSVLADVLVRVQSVGNIPWTEPALRTIWLQDLNWVNRLGALVLSVAKGLSA